MEEQSILLKQQLQTRQSVRPGEGEAIVPKFNPMHSSCLSLGGQSLSFGPSWRLSGGVFIYRLYIVYAMDLARLRLSRRSLNIIIATGPLFYLSVPYLANPNVFLILIIR